MLVPWCLAFLGREGKYKGSFISFCVMLPRDRDGSR